MVVIYDKDTGEIKGIWSGNENRIETIFQCNPEIAANWGDVVLPHNEEILQTYSHFKVELASDGSFKRLVQKEISSPPKVIIPDVTGAIEEIQQILRTKFSDVKIERTIKPQDR